MTTPTLASGPQRCEGARPPRPRVHGPLAAMEALSRHHGCGQSSAKHQISRALAVLDALADAARTDEPVRQWLRGRLAPLCARLRGESGALAAAIDAKTAADANEDIALVRCAASPTPENKRKLLAALTLEMARADDVVAALEVR